MSDRIFAVVWLLLCIGGWLVGWQIQSEYSYEPVGPRPFPLVILTLMALCALLLLIRRPQAVQWPPGRVLWRLVLMTLALFIYGGSFEWLGFPLASAFLICALALLFNARLKAALPAGVVMGGALYFLFDTLLDVTLPAGHWFN